MRITVSIFSYNGEVTWAVTGDRDTASDVDLVAAGITEGLTELIELVEPPPPSGVAKATKGSTAKRATAKKSPTKQAPKATNAGAPKGVS